MDNADAFWLYVLLKTDEHFVLFTFAALIIYEMYCVPHGICLSHQTLSSGGWAEQ